MPTKAGSVILFEDERGRIAFQLRDNRPDVSYPDYWGLFGGWSEPGETPAQTILREMSEELGLSLDRSQLKYVQAHRDGDILGHVFHYPAPSDLLHARLLEGQRLEFLNLADLRQRQVVPQDRAIVEAWLRHSE